MVSVLHKELEYQVGTSQLQEVLGHAAAACVSTRVRRESWTRAKKKKNYFRSNSRPITRLEALATQANAAEDQNQIRTSSW